MMIKHTKILIATAALTLPLFVFSQKPVEIASKVNSVTVYPRGAQIERTASKQLAAGRQFIVFPGLASEMDVSTISVSASGGIKVLSVSSQLNYMKESMVPKNVKLLQDSLKTAEFDFKFNQNMLGVYSEERTMILSNKSVGWGQGQDGSFSIEDLEDLSDFYRDRLADIMLKVMELEQKQSKLNLTIQRMRNQLNEYNSKLNRSTGEILVEIYAPSNMIGNFTLTYMVHNAGWAPSYNINVNEVDQPIQLSYNAKVYQNTGNDWNDVTLTLTNANPYLSGDKPEIQPWTLYFIENMGVNRPLRTSANVFSNSEYELAPSSDDAKKQGVLLDEGIVIDYPIGNAVTKFVIKTRYTIPSNGKQQGISIDDFTIPAKYQYYCAPKLDPAAFLIARVSGFDKYDLLPGNANLFFGNTYVGEMYLNPNVVTDTLDLSLGRDQSIIVKRQKIKDFNAEKKIGSSTKQSMGIEISVRNTKSTKVTLVIEDQIPNSSDKEIEVTADDIKGAMHAPETGKLKWTKNIIGGSTEIIQFRYSVKYPSGRKINL